jgi:alkylation response protein AidB-like acyl-CoA dehydrogenase
VSGGSGLNRFNSFVPTPREDLPMSPEATAPALSVAEVDERIAAIREETRRLADGRIRPLAAELDETERFPAELYVEMAALGLFGIAVPEAHGGAGADVLAYAAVLEELSRGYASVADQCGLVELVATLLSQHGSEAQRDAYVRPLLAGKRRCAYALTEAGAGSDLAGLRTTATPDGDGWRLAGEKLWIHNAPVADFALVLARTDPALGNRGMSIFVVGLDSPGCSRGSSEHKMASAPRRSARSISTACDCPPPRGSGRRGAAST